MRTSKKQVEYYISILNNYFKEGGSDVHYELESRNGYYAIDIYKGNATGCSNLDCGLTLKEAYIIIKNACSIIYNYKKEVKEDL